MPQVSPTLRKIRSVAAVGLAVAATGCPAAAPSATTPGPGTAI